MRTAVLLIIPLLAAAQDAPPPVSLRDISQSLERLSSRVRPAVVQVFTTSYTPFSGSDSEGTTTSLFSKQRGTGSGVLISADGYIVTNNHVVENGRRIQVRLPSRSMGRSILRPEGRTYPAKVVGIDTESDLALIKIEASALPFLALGDSDALHQGQLVVAFGNPLGLEGSVSMGVVSSVARQLKPDDPMIYVQTDAPINPGNSGGPLVDTDGRVIGINTFILSQSGGSEGIGFAVPANIVRTVVDQIKRDGHVHRGQIGAYLQTITPALAEGLKLSTENGVVVSDVIPDGPAAAAGLRIGDIIVALNGRPMENARQVEVNIYRQLIRQKVNLRVMRDSKTLDIAVPVVERDDDPMRFMDHVDPAQNLIPQLGILAIELTSDLASMVPELRFEHGLVVAARSSEAAANGLRPGDVIYSLNRTPAVSVKAMRAAIEALAPGAPAVLQLQRGNRVFYLSLDLE